MSPNPTETHAERPTASLPPVGDGDTSAWFAGDTPARPAPVPPGAAGETLSVPGYRVSGVLGRGGMGVVYAAEEEALGREVAIKTNLRPAAAGRFVREAEITARLPHPGVPPVHALGTLPDGSRFLVMKLVRGRTLAAQLAARVGVADDRPRFLRVFEQVCEAVGFAHSQGVIHRDLKPANVMVGAFGEVHVMDWGLAKALGAPADEGSEPGGPAAAPGGHRTGTGSVLGTPAYLAPEQARGEPADARSDVFGLGAVLCDILTGGPPFFGDTPEATLSMAARARTGDAFVRLAGCGADPQLAKIARRCLAADPAERPADGAAVAGLVREYLTGVAERLRRAEVERAELEVRAAERVARAELEAGHQRKRRRAQLALLAALLVLVAGGGAFAWWRAEAEAVRVKIDGDRQAAESLAAAERGFKEEQARQGARAALGDAADLRRRYRYDDAAAALARAADLARGGAPELVPAVEQAGRDLAFVRRLEAIRFLKWGWTAGPDGRGSFDTAAAPREYPLAFAAFGLDLRALDPDAAAERIAASEIKAELVAAVDDWAMFDADRGLRGRLFAIANLVDPEPLAVRLRDQALLDDKGRVQRLLAEVNPAAPPRVLRNLALAGNAHGLDITALLSAARLRHPTDFDLAFHLGSGSGYGGFGTPDQWIAHSEAARALRPDLAAAWLNLGNALAAGGKPDAAIAVYREALARDPGMVPVHTNLGFELGKKGLHGEATACFREAVRLEPTNALAHTHLADQLVRAGQREAALEELRVAVKHDPKFAAAHEHMGTLLADMGRKDDAIAAHREAVKHDPTLAVAHSKLGMMLLQRGELDAAADALRAAVKHDPTLAAAHSNLSIIYSRKREHDKAVAAALAAVKLEPDSSAHHVNLGDALFRKGDKDGAIVALKDAADLDPQNAVAYLRLGFILELKRDIDPAIAAYRQGVQLDPGHAFSHNRLGVLLFFDKNERKEGEHHLREALRLDPLSPRYHNALGCALRDLRRPGDAVASFKRALELDPRFAGAYHNLGGALCDQGDLDAAIAAYKKALELEPSMPDARNLLARAERLKAARDAKVAPPPRPARAPE